MDLGQKEAWKKVHHGPDFHFFLSQGSDAENLIKVPASKPDWGQEEALHKEAEIGQALYPENGPNTLEIEHKHVLVWPGSLTCLASLLEKGPLSLKQFFKWAIPMAREVDRLHQKNWGHFQINPQAFLFGSSLLLNDLYLVGESCPKLDRFRPKTLYYQAPEHINRTGHPEEKRSDLYSLGCLFYHMLLGRPAFHKEHTHHAIHHAHLTEKPRPLAHENEKVPAGLSLLVEMLMEKDAENRYQSALGLLRDLERAESLCRPKSKVNFMPRHRTLSRSFRLAKKLFGREEERSALLDAALRIKLGRKELVAISGQPGVGKTVLAQEVNAFQDRYDLLQGQADPYNQSRPYQVILDALDHFMEQILALGEPHCSSWERELKDIFGANARVFTDAVPKAKYILKNTKPVPSLAALQTKNRFFHVIHSFISNLATAERPLILVLDDLDRADHASLELLEWLLRQPEPRHWLVVVTTQPIYDPTEPIYQFLARIEEADLATEKISLENLDQEGIREFLATSFELPPLAAEDIAKITREKTYGNPFFMHRFLADLYQEELIWFDINRGWTWDAEAIRARPVTDNVVDFILTKLKKLSANQQTVLCAGACLGFEFAEEIIQMVPDYKNNLEATLLLLVHKELIIKKEEGLYQFSHVRIREMALNLLDPNAISKIHFELSQVFQIIFQTNTEVLYQLLFHLKAGMSWKPEGIDAGEACRWNLRAGRKARASGAYKAAASYLNDALKFFEEAWWQIDPDFSFELYMMGAECAYLGQEFERADERFAILFSRVRNDLEHCRILNLQVVLHTHLDRAHEAVDCGLEALKILGITIPRQAKKYHLVKPLLQIRWLLFRHRFKLAKMDEMSDERSIIAMEICGNLQAPAYILSSELYGLVTFTMVRLTLTKGARSNSSVAFINFSVVMGSALGKVEDGRRYADFALKWSTEFQDAWSQGRCQLIFGAVISHWKDHLSKNLDILAPAQKLNQESGDLLGVSYANHFEAMSRMVLGLPLIQVATRAEQAIAWTRSLRYTHYGVTSVLNMAKNLMGQTHNFGSFSGPDFDEEQWQIESKDVVNAPEVTLYKILKLQAAYMAGRRDEALEISSQLKNQIYSVLGQPILPQYHFYAFLALCLVKPGEMTHAESGQAKKHLKKMKKWAFHCAANFDHLHNIMLGEWARAHGDFVTAISKFERGIQGAKKHKYHHNEALAHERLALLHWNQKHHFSAEAHFNEAIRLYRSWGAEGKCKQLLKDSPIVQRRSSTDSTILPAMDGLKMESLELKTVLKAMQALSSKNDENGLTKTILNLSIKLSNAQKAALILKRDQDLWVIGGSQEDTWQIQEPVMLDSQTPLAQAPIHLAMRTGDPQVLGDVSQDTRFNRDPYIQGHQVRSLICMPLFNNKKLLGVLYLENNVLPNAFNRKHLATLEWFGLQSVIALEHARKETVLSGQIKAAQSELAKSENHIQTVSEQRSAQIRFAKDLQHQIFGRSEQTLKSVFTDALIIQRTVEVISQDQIWAQKQPGQLVLLNPRRPDVRGAMAGFTALYQMNRSLQRTQDPGEQLDQLHHYVSAYLKASALESGKNGLDAGILTWEQGRAKFAGANVLAFHLKPALGVEALDFTGQCGTAEYSSQKSQAFQIEQGDTLYLMSQGWLELFGEHVEEAKKAWMAYVYQFSDWDLPAQKENLYKELEKREQNQSTRDKTLIAIKG